MVISPPHESVGTQPPVSIGLPFYNAEAYLADAIKSVFAQTHANWELILVDDGSTDRSLEIARSVNDPRVRVYSDGQNKRLAARLNEITQLARYNLLARMDADDMMCRRRIEKQVRVLETRPQVDLVTTGVCSLRDNGEPMGVRCVPEGHRVVPTQLLEGKSGIVHASLLGRRNWFLRNPYDESLERSQDTNLWVTSHAKNDLSVHFISEPLYYYREDGNVTIEKLLLSYKIGRRMILRNARGGYRFADIAKAYTSTMAKSVVASLLSLVGKMDIIRERRNTGNMSPTETESIRDEIRHITTQTSVSVLEV